MALRSHSGCKSLAPLQNAESGGWKQTLNKEEFHPQMGYSHPYANKNLQFHSTPYICFNNFKGFVKPKLTIVAYENTDKKMDSVYSKRIKAGKRRTYFFDVRATRGNDYFLTITESRKRFNEDGYDRHKIFLYKEDFNKFLKGLNEAVDYVKTELMPDFDFDAFNHEETEGVEEETAAEDTGNGIPGAAEVAAAAPISTNGHATPQNGFDEQVDKW